MVHKNYYVPAQFHSLLLSFWEIPKFDSNNKNKKKNQKNTKTKQQNIFIVIHNIYKMLKLQVRSWIGNICILNFEQGS